MATTSEKIAVRKLDQRRQLENAIGSQTDVVIDRRYEETEKDGAVGGRV